MYTRAIWCAANLCPSRASGSASASLSARAAESSRCIFAAAVEKCDHPGERSTGGIGRRSSPARWSPRTCGKSSRSPRSCRTSSGRPRARAVELLEEFGARDALERGSRGRTRAVRVGPRRALAREGDPDAQLDEVTAVFRPRRPQGFVVSRLRLCCGGRRIGVPVVEEVRSREAGVESSVPVCTGLTLTCTGRCLLADSSETARLPLHSEGRHPSGAGCESWAVSQSKFREEKSW